MHITRRRGFKAKTLFTWQFLMLKLLLLALVAVLVDKPTGVLTGRISIGEKGFGLQTYDIRANKVYVIAEGPRQGPPIERGVWVQNDGTFKFDHLPVGEYQIRVRAKGFSSTESYGLFVQEGKTTQLPKTLALSVLEPSVSMAQTSRVFTTHDTPSMYMNAIGAIDGDVKLYKIDFLPFISGAQNKGIASGTDLNIYKTGETKLSNPLAKQKPLLERHCKLELDWTDSAHANVNFGKLPPGDYFAYVEVNGVRGGMKADNANWFSVSDVGLIVKRDENKVLVQAVDLNTLKPVKDCKVRGYDLEAHKYVATAMKTNENGLLEINDANAEASKSISPSGSKVAEADLSHCSLFVGQSAANMAYSGNSPNAPNGENYKSYFYTDKPIYRLGQTVNFKTICREINQGQLKNPGAGLSLAVHVDDPTNNTLWKGTLKTNQHGTFNGTFTIPADGKTGAYQVVADFPDGSHAYGAFEADQYRKPEYQVEVVSMNPRIVSGQKLRVQVKATYFFGAPVANASVKYTIYSSSDYDLRWRLEDRPSYFSFFDSWNEGESYGSGGEFVMTGTAQTDQNGLAMIEYDTTPQAAPVDANDSPSSPYNSDVQDKKYRVEAEVTDISRITQVGSGSTEVTAGDFALFVQPDAYVVKAGENMDVTAQAINFDGKPVANQPVTISVARWVYDSVAHVYKNEDKVAEVSATTGADGKATVRVFCKDQWPSDTFYVTAKSVDATKHKIVDHSSIWIASERSAYVKDKSDAEKQTVSITTDKQVYKPGDTAKVMITAPVTGKEGINALVTIEGAKLYQCKIVPLDATAKFVEIPISKELAPNAFVNVAFVGNKHQFYTAEQMIKVSPDTNFLKLAVTSDKDRYKPGDTAHYTIKATKLDGSPAPNTEVSLGVVDESIYSIRADAAEDIRKFFYTRRENVVITVSSFPEMYSAGPDKIEPKVRKDFKDTAVWLPDLTTNKDGIAIASVKLPDNLTTWRATVRGVSMGTDVGACTQKILCTQDLILRLALPRFFNTGDQGFITAIVHNYTKQPQSIKLILKASEQFTVKSALTQSASVDPEKAYRYSWPVTLAKSGSGVIEVKAIGQTAGDAMEMKLPVNPLGLPAFSIKTGLLTDDNASVSLPVGISADAVKGTESEKLTLASSTIGPVLGNFNALIDYPYGCTEQTLSKLVPSMVAMQLHKKLNIPITKEQSTLFAEVQKLSLEKLRSYHHDDGGWGWWATDSSNPYLTAHVVSGLSLLKETGYSAEDTLINSGLQWLGKQSNELQKQLADPKLAADDQWVRSDISCRKTDLSKMLYTISSWGATPQQLLARYAPAKKGATKLPPLVYHSELVPIVEPDSSSDSSMTAPGAGTKTTSASSCAVRAWLLSQTNRLSPEALSYLTLTCRNLNDNAGAQKAYDRLIALSQTDSQMMNWQHTSEMAKKFIDKGDEYSEYDYRFTGVESTALGLQAVLAMEPNNAERIESIKQWLLLQRDQNGWDNTKTTAQVFLVLLREELQYKSKSPADFQTKVMQSGQELFSLAYNATNTYGPEQTVDVKLSTAHSTLDITKTGSGRLYYTTVLNYFRQLLPGDQVAGKGFPVGLTITRKFYRLQPFKDKAADGAIHFKTEEIADHQIKAGETVMMKTFVHCPVPLPYIKVESALPSGAEVVRDSRESNVDATAGDAGTQIAGDWAAPWWTHEDVLDDRIVYFGTSVPRGDSEFHTMLRMELPGTVEVLPVTLEGMYSNKIRGYSALDQLTVKE